MSKNNIQTSGFSLAKEKELTGDDFYEVKIFDDVLVAVVCDGVGSAQEGALAAKRVTTHLINNFQNRPEAWSIEKSIKKSIESINAILYHESMQNYERVEMVTTVSVVVIHANRIYGANVGDSRVYLYRDNKLNQLSYDHIMNEAGYENVLTNAIGLHDHVEIFYFENNLEKDDKILLCSDGLYNVLNEKDLTHHLINGAYALVKKASRLTHDTLPDDTTAVVLDIQETDVISVLKNLPLDIPQSLKAGDEIDGFKLTRSLIQNDRTWVCVKDDKTFVIKFAPKEALYEESILDVFLKEVWNAKRLVNDIFPEFVVPDNRTARYYIMSYIEGTNLKSYLKKRHLSVDESLDLATTLLKMSQFLLKYDLVHGDIKPENIMILEKDGKKIFKIIDLGSITEIYSTISKAGTPSYLAPERFRQGAINEKTEIFSIGITLYESLTLKYPYGEIEPFQTPTFKQPKLPSKFNNNIPSWYESLLLRSISIDESLRYEHYSNILYELENTHKVKPYFDKNTPILQRDPLKFYKYGFFIMILLNFYLFLLLAT